MRPRTIFPVLLLFLLALIGLGLWWFLRPLTTAPAKTAAVPTLAKIDPVKVVAQSAEVEPPKAAPVPASGTVAVSTNADDSQSDLKTAIPDIVRMAQAGDLEGIIEKYTPPDELKKNQAYLQIMRQDMQDIQASVDSHDPKALSTQQMIRAQDDANARSWESLEFQVPTYNATGDEATYLHTLPDFSLANTPALTVPLTFIKINGRWYFKQEDAEK